MKCINFFYCIFIITACSLSPKKKLEPIEPIELNKKQGNTKLMVEESEKNKAMLVDSILQQKHIPPQTIEDFFYLLPKTAIYWNILCHEEEWSPKEWFEGFQIDHKGLYQQHCTYSREQYIGIYLFEHKKERSKSVFAIHDGARANSDLALYIYERGKNTLQLLETEAVFPRIIGDMFLEEGIGWDMTPCYLLDGDNRLTCHFSQYLGQYPSIISSDDLRYKISIVWEGENFILERQHID